MATLTQPPVMISSPTVVTATNRLVRSNATLVVGGGQSGPANTETWSVSS